MLRLSSFTRFLLLLTMCCVEGVTFAQSTLRPFPSGKQGFGYINSIGVYVIAASFRSASRFSLDGLANVVDMNGKHGFIDTNGNYIIIPIFDDLENPYRTDAPMRVAFGKFLEARYGFINTSGDLIVPAIYEFAYPFRNGFARVAMYGKGPYGQRPEKHGFVDIRGRLAVPLQFDDARSFGPNGLAAVYIDKRWGFINTSGEFVIQPKFDEVPNSPESVFDSFGLARVKQGKNWILLDAKGNQVGSAEGSSISAFNEGGLAIIGQTSILSARKLGVINTKGEYLFAPQFDDFKSFKNGFAQISINGKWGYIDSHGKIIVAPRFPIYGTDFSTGGTAQVVLGNRDKVSVSATNSLFIYGYINTSGRIILQDSQYDRIVIPYNSEGFAVVRKGEKSGFVNNEGKEAVGWFDEALNFTESGLAAVKQGEKWGYIDKSGNWIISPRFDRAFNFVDNGIALVEISKKLGHINTGGTVISPTIFEKLGTFGDDGLAAAKLNGIEGYVDLSGQFSTFQQAKP